MLTVCTATSRHTGQASATEWPCVTSQLVARKVEAALRFSFEHLLRTFPACWATPEKRMCLNQRRE